MWKRRHVVARSAAPKESIDVCNGWLLRDVDPALRRGSRSSAVNASEFAVAMHPHCAEMVAQLQARRPPQVEDLTAERLRAFVAKLRPAGSHPQISDRIECREVMMPGHAGPVRCLVFAPRRTGGLPVAIHLHGGGWVVGSPEDEAFFSARIAAEAPCVVISISYPLAPEHPYPAAINETYAALQHVAKFASNLGGDAERIGLIGGSAGANIAAAVALLARDRGGPTLSWQVLLVPTLQHYVCTRSRKRFDGQLDAPAGWLDWYSDQYLVDRSRASEPLAGPLESKDLSGLPPTFIGVAELDPLRDEGELYAARLSDSGVAVETVLYERVIHSFIRGAGSLREADAAITDAAGFIRRHSSER
jgi:acetyl esterase